MRVTSTFVNFFIFLTLSFAKKKILISYFFRDTWYTRQWHAARMTLTYRRLPCDAARGTEYFDRYDFNTAAWFRPRSAKLIVSATNYVTSDSRCVLAIFRARACAIALIESDIFSEYSRNRRTRIKVKLPVDIPFDDRSRVFVYGNRLFTLRFLTTGMPAERP